MYNNIECLRKVKLTNQEKVNELIASLLSNGWSGVPILYYADLGLVTGSHRVEALNQLETMQYDVDEETQSKIDSILENVEAIEVSDIVDNYCNQNDVCWEDLDFSNLGSIFTGTEIEKYKDEIEW